jgi:hypothetical protein
VTYEITPNFHCYAKLEGQTPMAPPQPGIFALPYTSTHKPRVANELEMAYAHHSQSHHSNHAVAGPSSRVQGTWSMSSSKKQQLHVTKGAIDDGRKDRKRKEPASVPLYNLHLYPISIERSALLAQYALEEQNSLACVQTAYEEERERVEEEWRKGHDRIRERLLEGIEERRRRAREEKEGEGTVGGILHSNQSRSASADTRSRQTHR